jgi:hypothetical protein
MASSVRSRGERADLPRDGERDVLPGQKDQKPEDVKSDPIPEAKKEEPAAKDAKVAAVQVLPFDVVTHPGMQVKLHARTFDEKGRLIADNVKDAKWSIARWSTSSRPRRCP